MSIHRLKIISVRNHKEAEFFFSRGVTVIWGENGSGKTAVLEAIHMISIGRSFKTHRQRELINVEKNELFIQGDFSNNNQEDHVASSVTKTSGQIIKLNGKNIHSRKELLGRNIVVVLSPEQQNITKGAPEERRRFFNKIFSVVSPAYFGVLQEYNRALKQRNAALLQLRDNRVKDSDLQSWTPILALSGLKLWGLRRQLMHQFKSTLGTVLNQFDRDIELEILYDPRQSNKEQYQNKLEKNINRDIVLGRTEHGPHRDNFIINWAGKNIKSYGSQGENKLCLILLKLAELFFVKEKTGKTPILLLDDLFAKLDLERCKKIVNLLQGFDDFSDDPLQTIVTTTDLINIENSGLMFSNGNHRTYHLKR